MRNWYEFKASASGEETELLLYGEIGGFGISAESFMAALKQVPANHKINLRIYSPGGSVFDGNVIYGALGRHPGGVVTHIDGLAASMASVIALAGTPVKMASNALFMIHNVSGGAFGDAEDMRKTADLLEKVQDTIVDAYKKKTKMSRAAIEAMMNEETWMTAKEAKEHGFIDEITDPLKMAASFDLSKFKNAPKQFDITNNSKAMTIETPEFLALQAEHKTTCEMATTLKADLEARTLEVTTLAAKLTEAEAKTAEATAALEKATAEFVAKTKEHETALADFDAKVNLRAAELLAQTGANPIALGTGSASSDASVYDEFKAADPVKARQMYSDPNTKARIAAESARRMTVSK